MASCNKLNRPIDARRCWVLLRGSADFHPGVEWDCCLLVATGEKGGVFSDWSWDSDEPHCAPNSREKWTAACLQPQLAPDQRQQSSMSAGYWRQRKAEGPKLEALSTSFAQHTTKPQVGTSKQCTKMMMLKPNTTFKEFAEDNYCKQSIRVAESFILKNTKNIIWCVFLSVDAVNAALADACVCLCVCVCVCVRS